MTTFECDNLEALARGFCESLPYRLDPFNKRNWGGEVHSLCSYHGKLKPSIAHFLIRSFTSVGDRVLDPLGGVGTIPLEARRQGRLAISNDLSPFASTIARAKIEPIDDDAVERCLEALEEHIEKKSQEFAGVEVLFGLNKPISDYYHPVTLQQLLAAREFFLSEPSPTASTSFVLANLLHILHGNRPYALSRRSHPVTPFAPTGDAEPKAVMKFLRKRTVRSLPEFVALNSEPAGSALHGDFRDIALDEKVDAIVTSPPFERSLRFWSMNWLRLWFSGWEPTDFASEPSRYLEAQQKKSLLVYEGYFEKMRSLIRPEGILVMHLGRDQKSSMADGLAPAMEGLFRVVHVGEEDVSSVERHGIRDKGATSSHIFLFAKAC